MSERLRGFFYIQIAPFLVTALILLAPLGQPLIGASSDIAYSQGRLWKVSGESGATSYVFGTMHVSDDRVIQLPEPVDDALSESSLLMVELIFDGRGLAELSDLMQLKDGRRLYDILGADLFTRVADRLEEGTTGASLNRLQPWIVALMLSQPSSGRMAAASNQPFLDLKLQQEAVTRGADVVALESFAEQVAPFANLSEEELVAYIDAAIAVPYWQTLETYNKLRDAYLSGDLAALYRLSRIPGIAELGEQIWEGLIDRRNDTMVERMKDAVARGGAFVAVGALHLPGERGVLQQLADRGFTVERVY